MKNTGPKGPGFANSTLNRDATRDGIRIFVDGEGDLNPLFRDPDYGKKTKYKCLIAPPNYLYSICYTQRPYDHSPMLPGMPDSIRVVNGITFK